MVTGSHESNEELKLGKRILLLAVTTALTIGVAEYIFRLANFDFDFKEKAFLKEPIFYRQPTVPFDRCFYRRRGPDRWTGRVINAKLDILKLPTDAYADEPVITIRYDRDGFRNPDDLNDWELVFAGDSFLELGNLAYEDLYTTRVALELQLRVKNLGVSSTGTSSQTAFLRAFGPAQSARDAFLCFYEGNDLVDLTREVKYCKDVQRRNINHADLGDRIARQPNQSSLIRAIVHAAQRKPKPVPDPSSFVNATLELQGERVEMTISYLPVGSKTLDEKTMALLTEAIVGWGNESRRLGMRPWVVFLPTKLRVMHDRLSFKSNADPRFAVWEPTDLPEVLEEMAIGNDTGFIDVTPALRREIMSGRLTHNPYWDTHLTRSGSHAVAHAIAEEYQRLMTISGPNKLH